MKLSILGYIALLCVALHVSQSFTSAFSVSDVMNMMKGDRGASGRKTLGVLQENMQKAHLRRLLEDDDGDDDGDDDKDKADADVAEDDAAEDAADDAAEDAAEDAADASDAAEDTADAADDVAEGDDEPADAEEALLDASDASSTFTGTCPIDLTSKSKGAEEGDTAVLGEILDDLVDPCKTDAATLDNADLDFCGTCVRPLQTFLAREFHLADLMRDMDTEDWDSGDTALHEKCAQDVTDYLTDKGMNYDDNFHANVLACANYAADPTCKFTTEELVEMPAIKEALDACESNKDTLSPDMVAAMGVDSNATHPFCADCYWKFFEAIVKKTMSDDFLCMMKNDQDADDSTRVSDLKLEKSALEDPHMFSCLLNVEGYLREQNRTSASIGFSEMEEICFNDLNRPVDVGDKAAIRTWIFHEDMQPVLDKLTCDDKDDK